MPKIYIFCTHSEVRSLTDLMRQKVAAEKAEWTSFELPSCHLPQATMPYELTQLLLKFCD